MQPASQSSGRQLFMSSVQQCRAPSAGGSVSEKVSQSINQAVSQPPRISVTRPVSVSQAGSPSISWPVISRLSAAGQLSRAGKQGVMMNSVTCTVSVTQSLISASRSFQSAACQMSRAVRQDVIMMDCLSHTLSHSLLLSHSLSPPICVLARSLSLPLPSPPSPLPRALSLSLSLALAAPLSRGLQSNIVFGS